jgi:hypothetical protein
MGATEIAATIAGLIKDLIDRGKDTKTAKLASQIQAYQHQLEETIHQDRDKHAKEIAGLRKAHKYEMAELKGACAGEVDSQRFEHSDVIAAKDRELATLKSECAKLTDELNKIKALQKAWSRKPRPPLGEFEKDHP